MITVIVRLILTMLLVYAIYLDAGVWVALFAALVAIRVEAVDFCVHKFVLTPKRQRNV